MQVFSCEFCETFKSNYIYRTPLMAALVLSFFIMFALIFFLCFFLTKMHNQYHNILTICRKDHISFSNSKSYTSQSSVTNDMIEFPRG